MSLEKRISSKDIRRSMVFTALALLPAIGTWGFAFGKTQYIKNHLEKDAIVCSTMANVTFVRGVNLPLTRNKDIDNDGLYESVLFYKNADGRIMYQEISKNSNRTLVLSAPNFYK